MKPFRKAIMTILSGALAMALALPGAAVYAEEADSEWNPALSAETELPEEDGQEETKESESEEKEEESEENPEDLFIGDSSEEEAVLSSGKDSSFAEEIQEEAENSEEEEEALEKDGSLKEEDPSEEERTEDFGISETAMDAPLSEGEEDTESSLPDDYIEGIVYMGHRNYTYDMPIRFIYSDSYFFHDSTEEEFNQNLAAMSAAVGCTSGPSYRAGGYIYEDGEVIRPETIDKDERYENQSRNIQDMLRIIGFEKIEVNDDYKKTGDPITAGVVCGMKKITDEEGKEYTLIGLFPRSVGYLGEWANNAEVGYDQNPETETDSDFYGVSKAASDTVLPFLKEYLEKNQITGELKIWAAGMSRGGGLINLTAAYIDDNFDDNGHTDSLLGLEGVELSAKDVYAYTFGSPHVAHWNTAGEADEETGMYVTYPQYKNIHNFVARYDFMNMLMIGGWNLSRYGVDTEIFLETMEENKDELINYYAVINNKTVDELADPDFLYIKDGKVYYAPLEFSTEYYTDEERTQTAEMNLSDFMSRFMINFTTNFPRDAYAEHLQTGAQLLVKAFYGTASDDDSTESLTADVFKEAALKVGGDIAVNVITCLMNGDMAGLKELVESIEGPYGLIADILLEAFDSTGRTADWDYEEREAFDDPKSMEAHNKSKAFLQGILESALPIIMADPLGIAGMMKTGDSLWSSHETDVYLSWQRLYSGQEQQDIYLKPVTEAEAWGYRMIALPEDADHMSIQLYEGYENTEAENRQAVIQGNILSFCNPEDYDHFIHMTVDSEGKRILYLRTDREYTLEFIPDQAGVRSAGLDVTEYKYLHSHKIYDPNTYELHFLEDDYGIPYGSLVLNWLDGESLSVSDSLLMNIGSIAFYDPESGVVLLQKANDSSREAVSHFADSYTLSKFIELGGTAETGGSVSDLQRMLICSSDQNTKTATLTAEVQDGYEFLGWYLNGTLLSKDLTITREFSFLSSSELLTARFAKKPDEETASSSDPETIVIIPVHNEPAKAAAVPNTADHGIAWLVLLIGNLMIAAGSAYILRKRA